jgi:hypothetical protein
MAGQNLPLKFREMQLCCTPSMKLVLFKAAAKKGDQQQSRSL